MGIDSFSFNAAPKRTAENAAEMTPSPAEIAPIAEELQRRVQETSGEVATNAEGIRDVLSELDIEPLGPEE